MRYNKIPISIHPCKKKSSTAFDGFTTYHVGHSKLKLLKLSIHHQCTHPPVSWASLYTQTL